MIVSLQGMKLGDYVRGMYVYCICNFIQIHIYEYYFFIYNI